MQNRHRQRSALRFTLIWLFLSALLAVFLFAASQSLLDVAVKEQVRQHLLLTLDESLFGETQDRRNDQEGLQRMGEQINIALQSLVVDHWYSAERECVVRLQRVDDVTIDEQPMSRHIPFSLPRKQIEREVVIGLSCSRNGRAAVAVAGLLGLLFVAISYLLPPPLSKTHRQWINYLLERGYSGEQAFEIVRLYDATQLSLSPTQMTCLEQLHNSGQLNFSRALEVVSDKRVAALDASTIDWFTLGLHSDLTNLSHALSLAGAEDLVVIDLVAMTLSIHGLPVAMSRTPLFYYAWYAMSRVSGDGWITNPASNRPDQAAGRELVQLMSRFEGHARAVNDLEQTGLKARTLDQNRSKIKDDIVPVLGEKLAASYLFEASKHLDGVRMQYRLQVDPGSIRIYAGQERIA